MPDRKAFPSSVQVFMSEKKDPSVLAIIPARGGSKRLANKNIRDFCGRPMISYSLEAAQSSGVFDEIHVSTESEIIGDVVVGLGYRMPFLRPAELADDHTPLIPVLRWVLQEYGRRGRAFDAVCLIMPCAPLLTALDLVSGMNILRDGRNKMPVLSVAPYPVPVEWAYSRGDDGLLSAREPGMFAVRSQDLGKSYYDTGGFAFFPAARILDEAYVGGTDMLSVVLPSFRAVDIDDAEDFERAEILYLGLQEFERNKSRR
jgi:pseudaminic acid cytidylyltransferase